MFKKLVVILFLLLFITTAEAATQYNSNENQQNPSEQQIMNHQEKLFTFIFNALVLEVEIFPAIYKYLDLSKFENPPTVEQQEQIMNNIHTVIQYNVDKQRIIITNANMRFTNNGTELLIFIYFYEYNTRSLQLEISSIGKNIIIFKKTNNSELLE